MIVTGSVVNPPNKRAASLLSTVLAASLAVVGLAAWGAYSLYGVMDGWHLAGFVICVLLAVVGGLVTFFVWTEWNESVGRRAVQVRIKASGVEDAVVQYPHEICFDAGDSRVRPFIYRLKCEVSRITDPHITAARSQTTNTSAPTQNQVNDKLVPCPRCTNQVSPQAVNCPFCGEPIAGGLFRINRGTREKTPKFVKVSRPLGWLLLILSGAGFMADMLLGDGTHYVPWIIGACLAICLLVYVEIGQWWHQS